MRKDQRKLDKKRKKKLEEKKRHARRAESLAYMGNKYKADELIPTWMHTEIGIYETYVMTDRKLVDQTAASSLETLIRKMRAGTLPPFVETDEIHYELGREEDLVIENIRRSWAKHFATEWQPPQDKLIGVLRTILGSIEKVKSPGPQSQSYIKHIAGFLTKKLGVSVKTFSADRKPIPEPEDDELVRLGREWHTDGDLNARAELFGLATDLLRSGQPRRVINACHLLMGEVSDPSSDVVVELMELSRKANESLITAMG
jgi:hypothetical protein